MTGKLEYQNSKLIFLTATGREISVDFEDPKLIKRVKQGLKSNLLIKALALNKNKGTIIDCTAGLGVDSFLASAFGANVIMCERSPIMSKLLSDAMQRAESSTNTQIQDILSRLKLIACNAIDAIDDLSKEYQPKCIYLDPMYPDRKKSALGKIGMREILNIVGNDQDSGKLLDKALLLAPRVVVKRPKLAPTLTELSPNFKMIGNSTRFDIYITQNGY